MAFDRRSRQLYFVIRNPDFNGPICVAFVLNGSLRSLQAEIEV
jgi:hypothetical protein